MKTIKALSLLIFPALFSSAAFSIGSVDCVGYDTTNTTMVRASVANNDGNPIVYLVKKNYRDTEYQDIFMLKSELNQIQSYHDVANSLMVVAAHHKSSIKLVADFDLFGGDISDPEESHYLGELFYTYGDSAGEMKSGRARVRCEYGI